MNVLVLVAGTNDPSNSDYLADIFIEGIMNVHGVSAQKIRVNDVPLPQFELLDYACKRQGPEFDRIRALIQEASGIVIASPVWNFSVPAHLKNFLDHIGCFSLDAETRSKGKLRGIPCYILFTGGAPKIAWKGLMRLTTMHVPETMRYFGASIAGVHFEGRCMEGPGRFGFVLDRRPALKDAMRKKGRKFALVIRRFSETGTLPFSYRVISRLYAFGQRVLTHF